MFILTLTQLAIHEGSRPYGGKGNHSVKTQGKMSSQVRTCSLCSLYCVFIDYMPEPAASPGVSYHAWDHRWGKCTKIFYLSRLSLSSVDFTQKKTENICLTWDLRSETHNTTKKSFMVLYISGWHRQYVRQGWWTVTAPPLVNMHITHMQVGQVTLKIQSINWTISLYIVQGNGLDTPFHSLE